MIGQNAKFNVSTLLLHRRRTKFCLRMVQIVTIASMVAILWLRQHANVTVHQLKPINKHVLGLHTSQPSACRSLIRDDVDDRQREICHGLVDGTQSVKKTPLLHARRFDKTADYISCVTTGISNCSHFRSALGYMDYVTPVERDFPLAFSLLTYENFEQTERLLRLIYRPHNVYCLHVDAKSSPEMHSAAEAVASCLPNVFIAWPPVNVLWGDISVVKAELRCIKLLLASNSSWKYFINLVGRDFPLRTNRELVEILKAYRGANDVAGTWKNRYLEWYHYSWIKDRRIGKRRTGKRKTDPPHGFIITRGSTHMAVTRAFTEFALNDRRATELLQWMSDVKVPDAHFFQTLNHNPQFNISGSFRGNPDKKRSLTRMKIWRGSRQFPCAGSFIRSICDISEGDLPLVTTAPHMFVNKIRMENHPTAFRCLEQWFVDRLRREATTPVNADGSLETSLNYPPNFNVSFYANQPFVLRHV